MRKSLIQDVCCPACEGTLELREMICQDGNVIEGELRCVCCSSLYPIHKGIPQLVTPETRVSKLQEMEGWVSIWRKKGMYDEPPPEYGFNMPQAAGPEVARLFEVALQEMDLQGNEVILDLGGGTGWASNYFAQKGCKVIAVDIVLDDWYALGRSWAIMEHAGTYFEPVFADGDNLPFLPNQFDIVFFFGALHHFQDFDQVLRQARRALKPGGRLIAAGEPSIWITAKERDVQATIEETYVGITERRPKTYQYWRALEKAGFESIQCDILETYRRSPAQVYRWITDAGHNLCRVARIRYKPLVWLAFTFFRLLPCSLAAWLALCINGGNLFLRAVKPALPENRISGCVGDPDPRAQIVSTETVEVDAH